MTLTKEKEALRNAVTLPRAGRREWIEFAGNVSRAW